MNREQIIKIVANVCIAPKALRVGEGPAEAIVDAMEREGVIKFTKVLVCPDGSPECNKETIMPDTDHVDALEIAELSDNREVIQGEVGREFPNEEPSEDRTDLSKCPKCGGPADNGHDRCDPPSPYCCSKCDGSK